MRVWLLVYGVLYVVVELTGSALSSVGWSRITALDVASAVTDAFLVVSVALAALLAVHLAARRWGPLLLTPASAGEPVQTEPAAPIGVRSWRAEPLALPAAAPAPPPTRGTYQVGAIGWGSRRRAGRVAPGYPEEPGALL